ncbi:hypothetical protein NUW58_g10331 [Xylaria curta]|uniref:Uncharacterized protein n=1 Tax=Xylaria curta TaxID=42375 RepID=A0ACC1MNM5_9PEZI|nr:hypothetical protein NUW58_g10331 [Xylaria curta]
MLHRDTNLGLDFDLFAYRPRLTNPGRLEPNQLAASVDCSGAPATSHLHRAASRINRVSLPINHLPCAHQSSPISVCPSRPRLLPLWRVWAPSRLFCSVLTVLAVLTVLTALPAVVEMESRSLPQALSSSYAPRLRTYNNALLAPVLQSTAPGPVARTTKRGTTVINYAEDGYDYDDDDDDDNRRRPHRPAESAARG